MFVTQAWELYIVSVPRLRERLIYLSSISAQFTLSILEWGRFITLLEEYEDFDPSTP